MRLVYMAILAALGFYLGNLAHVFVGYLLAAGGVYLGWKIGAAGDAYRAGLAANAAVEVEQLSAYKALYRDLDIVGESYRQDAIQGLWAGPDVTFDAIMIPESNNSHDRNAVRVEIKGVHVGYLSRDTAKDYRSSMSDKRCKVPVHLVMGGPDGTIGVFTGRSKADNEKLQAASRKPSA
jgi:hypothetical protein